MGLPKDIKREAAAILNEARPADSAPSKKPAYLKTLAECHAENHDITPFD